jgi:hypothetical protein
MDRRDTIKSVLIGSLSGGLVLAGCAPATKEKVTKESSVTGPYGRTDKEKARDAKLTGETFFTEHELTTDCRALRSHIAGYSDCAIS